MFDEATSALDAESEKLVQDAIQKVSADATVLAIAHRISTIKDSDNIFVISDGRVTEEGDFSTLMDKRGLFFQLNQEN